ncbi:MAG TPA: DUF4112 domain-containing protein [Gemmatimonadaceae bacterium]|nr:DUF4112 domain-containing protein [Gemmatimonadaceae bacterium]
MTDINPTKKGVARDDFVGDAPDARAKRVRVLAKLLDNAITVPGTGWKIGLDPIVGLIPGIGDLITAVMSGYIILEAARADVSPFTLARMVTNVGIDTLVGAIPALGDVFDAAWKSNTKNVALLERHLASSGSAGTERSRGSIGATALILVVLVVILGAGLALGIYVARLLWGLGTR